eukprot:6410978-Pyramimonas_sp.AAC.1
MLFGAMVRGPLKPHHASTSNRHANAGLTVGACGGVIGRWVQVRLGSVVTDGRRLLSDGSDLLS